MDAFDRQILQFFVWWAPFGGPPAEDVLPCFGLTPSLLCRRFRQVVSSLVETGAKLDDDDAKLLAAARRILLPRLAAPTGNVLNNTRLCRMNAHEAKSGHAKSPLSAGSPPSVRSYDRRGFRQRR